MRRFAVCYDNELHKLVVVLSSIAQNDKTERYEIYNSHNTYNSAITTINQMTNKIKQSNIKSHKNSLYKGGDDI